MGLTTPTPGTQLLLVATCLGRLDTVVKYHDSNTGQYHLVRGAPTGGLSAVRPIAISETWYRFAGVCALRIYGRGIYGRWPCPAAGGVGTQGGTETVAYVLASALVEVPETGFISVDMANTFNSIHRAGECDRATPRVCCCLRSRCSLCWSGLMQCARRHRLCRTWTT